MNKPAAYDDIAGRVATQDAPPPPQTPREPPMLRAIDQAAEAVGVVILNVICALVLVNACGRYVFSRPLVWTEEIVAALLIWLVMIGAFLALLRKGMIASTTLLDGLPPGPRIVMDVLSNALAAVTFGFLAYVGWRYLGLFGGDKTPYFGLPKGFFMAALPVMATMMGLVSVFYTIETSARRPR